MTAAASLSAYYRERLLPAHIHSNVLRQLDAAVEAMSHHLDEGEQTGLLRDPVEKLGERRRVADDPFMLFVVGMGNVGKSSLVNALLGRAAATVKLIPWTWKIDLYEAADEESATIRYAGGRTERTTLEAARERCEQEEKRAKAARKAKREYRGEVVEVRWRLTSTLLPRGLILVDTPGLHQVRPGLDLGPAGARSLMNSSEELVGLAETYLHKADGVLWLLKADALNDAANRRAIEEMAFFRREQYAVLTYIDHLTAAGGTVESALAKAQTRFGRYFGRFVAVNARAATESASAGGLPVLRQLIDGAFVSNARHKKLAATVALIDAECGAAERMCRTEAARIQRLLDSARKVDDALSKATSRERNALIKAAGRGLDRIFDPLFERLTEEFGERLANASADHQRRRILREIDPSKAVNGLSEQLHNDGVASLTDTIEPLLTSIDLTVLDYDFRGREVPISTTERGLVPGGPSGAGLSWLDPTAFGGASLGDWGVAFGAYAGLAFLVNPVVGIVAAVWWLLFGNKAERLRKGAEDGLTKAKEEARTHVLRVANSAVDETRNYYENRVKTIVHAVTGCDLRAALHVPGELTCTADKLVEIRGRPLIDWRRLAGGKSC